MKSSAQRWFQQNGLTALISLLALGALVAIGFETRWGTSLSSDPDVLVGKVNKSDDTSLLPAFALPAIDAGFKETVERPLFLPTRRPVPIVTGAARPLMVKGKYRLAGTVVNQAVPVAFLVDIATGKSMRVTMGAEIVSTGISVTAVDAARVVLSQGDESEELSLRTASSPRPAPTIPGQPMGAPTAAQRPQPAGVVVGAIPVPPSVALPAGAAPIGPRPGSSVMPGWVLGAPAAAPANAAPVNPADSAAGNQRRRRFQNQNVPPQ